MSHENRSAGSALNRRQRQHRSLLHMVELAVLVAIVMVLHFTGTAIPAFGTKISLVLIPIALGAMLMGPYAGAFLGFVYGVTVFVSLGVLHADAFTGFLFDNTPVAAALICIVKTTLAGFVAGWAYKLLKQKNGILAVFVAAALVPTINTGVFILGCLAILGTIESFLASAELTFSGVYFIMIVCAGVNYALELAVNLILAPALERILRMVNRQLLR